MHNTSPLYKNVTGTPRSPWADISILQMEKSFRCGTADRWAGTQRHDLRSFFSFCPLLLLTPLVLIQDFFACICFLFFPPPQLLASSAPPPPPPLHSTSQFKSHCKCLLLKSCCRAKIFCWHALFEPWRLQEHVLPVISFLFFSLEQGSACMRTSPLDLSDLDLTTRAAVSFFFFFSKTMNNAAQSPLRSINYGSR